MFNLLVIGELFTDIVTIIMHWQQGPYTVYIYVDSLAWQAPFFVFSVSVISLNF